MGDYDMFDLAEMYQNGGLFVPAVLVGMAIVLGVVVARDIRNRRAATIWGVYREMDRTKKQRDRLVKRSGLSAATRNRTLVQLDQRVVTLRRELTRRGAR